MTWKRVFRSGAQLAFVAALIYGGTRVYAWLDQPPPVDVSLAQTESVSRILALTGRMRPRLINSVVPLVSGRLVSLRREEGEAFRTGDVLAEIDDRSARAVLAQARAREQLRREEMDQELRELDRARGLFGDGLIARAALEDAELAVERSEQALAQLAEAVVEAETRLEDFVLRAPFDGFVLRRPIDSGQTVAPTTIIYEIGTEGEAFVEAEVDERYLAELRVGTRAAVVPLNGGANAFEAELVYISRQVDPRTGAAVVRFQFHGEPPSLPAGLTLDVNVLVDEHENAVTVPKAALGRSGRNNWVLTLDGGRATKRPVTVIDWPAERVVVMDGLTAGEPVLLEPRDIPPGTEVRLRSEPRVNSVQADEREP